MPLGEALIVEFTISGAMVGFIRCGTGEPDWPGEDELNGTKP